MNRQRHSRNSPRSPLQNSNDLLPKKLPHIRLRHGQVLWLLTELGYRGSASNSAFFEYIKSLRKLGIPFGHERFQTARRKRLACYSYFHLMELAIALSLRVYHVVPDAVLKGVVRHRGQLNRFYGRAYAQRDTGAGKTTRIKVQNRKPIQLRGLFLDLNIAFAGGHLVRFGPPELLPGIEALTRFTQGTPSGRAFIPLSLSLLSERVVALALRAPQIRSGPRRGDAVG